MSDVHTQDAPERMAKQRGDTPGGFIWYELMTTDPAGAKRFLRRGRPAGASDGFRAPGIDYRMINRSDGRMAGGVLTLTDEMQQDGARPIWVGYIHQLRSMPRSRRSRRTAARHDGALGQPGVGRFAMVTEPEGAPFY